MKSIKVIFFILILSFANNIAKSQIIKKFTDTEKFIEELTIYMEKEDKTKTKEIMDVFIPLWTSEKFSKEKKEKIFTTANSMVKKKMKAFPHFNNYLQAVINFSNSTQNDKSFFAWISGLEKLTTRSTSSKFLFYLEVTNNLLVDNVIYKSNFSRWSVNKTNYIFDFDSVPKLIFPTKLNLKCNSRDDSTSVYNTSGVYYPTENLWKGNGGIVYWDKAKFNKDSVYAELKKYKIEMKSIKYVADSVNFFMKMYFEQPLIGQLTDKVQFDVTSEKSNYPDFISYEKTLKIASVFPNIDYEGGFALHGSKIMGNGTKDKKAKLTFYKDNKPFVVAQSLTFMIKKKMIASEKATATIYFENDSIFHPLLELKYLNEKNELSLVRIGEGIIQSPYYDSYHKIDMYFEALTWKMDEPKINFTMIQSVGGDREATFESADYYEEKRYARAQGISEIHPFQTINDYAKKTNSKELNVVKFSNYMRHQSEDVRSLIINLACQGFLSYNPLTDNFIINNKMDHYLKSKYGKNDYDIIKFKSNVTRGENASLDFKTWDLKLKGIASIILSDSHIVVIKPYQQLVTLKKNRDFDFMGKIEAGKAGDRSMFEFYGKDFNFVYDEFKVNMNNVDSFTFRVPTKEKDDQGNPVYERIRTMIEGVNGDLLIDRPDNKSGYKSLKNYPKFNSKKDSYAFYDKKNIYGGVYNRENFYYQLEPFSFDSLDAFHTEGIKFGGYFASAGIFPDFDDSLTVQSDYSLGFQRNTPKEGFSIYDGKGTYFNKISLSNKGLHGNGELKYITSTSKSSDYTFFPDSTNADLYAFDIKEQKEKIEYPPVKGEDVYMHWMPYDDLMQVFKKQNPMDFYAGRCKMHGRIDLSPLGLEGDGRMEFPTADLESTNFKYKHITFDADTSDFKMKSEGKNDLAFVTLNYKAHIDLKENKGEFKSNSETSSKVEFPVNQYISFMDEFTWFMDKQEIDMSSKEKDKKAVAAADSTKGGPSEFSEVNLSGSRFVSTHPAQDSLTFYSPKAKYSLKENIISAEQVKFIKIADAAIIPDSGKVTILKRAEMKTLEKSKITANTTTQYHNFYNCSTNILARNNYKASGNIDYVDETNKKQKLNVDKIFVDSTYQTVALGEIDEKAQFKLSPYFDYYGSFKISGSNPFLKFTGNCMIKHNCGVLAKSWLHFSSDINPNEIYIPVPEQPFNDNKVKIFTGVLHAMDSSVYSSFIAKKYHENDDELILAKGFLYFDKDLKEYHIAEMERIKDNKLSGNYMSLNSYCDVYTEGKINLSKNLEMFKLSSFGNIMHKTKSNVIKLDLVAYMDFFFSEKCLKLIAENFNNDANAQPVNIGRETYYKALINIMGQVEADKLIGEINLYGSFKKIPTELEHTFFLPELTLKWNSLTESYVSEGKIGIGNILRTQVNKQSFGFVELKKKKNGDVVTIYLEDGNKNWYYFKYTKNLLQVISSSEEFNKIIKEMKTDDRQKKAEKEGGGKEIFTFQLTSEKQKRDFLKTMGIEK